MKETGAAVWDTAKDSNGKDPLLTAKYTLVIHDADQEVTAVPSAGHLGSYSQFTFGMYLKQEYTPLGGMFFLDSGDRVTLETGTDAVFQISSVRLAAELCPTWIVRLSSFSSRWA